ncbi:MAG TPA: FtsX-like permease family protein [Treponemataceae bacterium]|nr:FtsX-like permease family protein [Treponemataceae bacterium]
MKWILELAARNLLRNKRRTSLAIVSMFLTVFLMTFLGSFVDGMMQNFVDNVTRNDSGHVRVTSRDFDERQRFMPVDANIPDSEAVVSAIQNISELAGEIALVEERILFGNLLGNGNANKTAVAYAGDPEKERELLRLDKSIAEGRYIENSGETIIGRGLAEDLNLSVNDELRVVATGADYGLHLKKFKIVGIFNTGMKNLDDVVFQVSLKDAQMLLRTFGGSQQVLVMLKDYNKAEEAAVLIRASLSKLPGAENLIVRPWTEIGEYPALILTMESTYDMIYYVVGILGAFIITNIMMMVVLERRREIGILKAMGLKKREVLMLFFSEGILIGLIGSFLGALIGFILTFSLRNTGLDFSSSLSSINYPINPIIYLSADPLMALKMVAIGTGLSALVSFLPSRKAAKMNVIEAIQSVV